ncbi:MAG: DUF72 domain-containing protein [Chlorobia bacterium]|nr:DUF72 domain-containing protein [Fimbriimonadaceae bacterium]
MAQLHIGLSGYDYKEWHGDGLFYPPTIKRAEFLQYYASRFNSLESNGTFQSAPSEATVGRWIEGTPPEFTFSPKMVQSVTHFKRLNGEAVGIAVDFVKALEPVERVGKLGPIFLQLPPNFKRNDDLLDSFLASLPHRPTLRWEIEFRNDSWNTSEVEEILRKHGVAWVAAETDDEPAQLRDTVDFLFVRLRRLEYTDGQLQEWANFLRTKIAEGKDCYVYCRHKDTIAPWLWADRIKELVGS